MKTLLSNVKKLQSITPSDEYRAKSLAFILGNPQLQKSLRTRFFEGMRYSIALTLTAIVIVVAAGGFSYLNWSGASPLIIGSLNAKSIAAEAARVDEELKLAQISFYGSAAQDVAMALNEVAQGELDHLNATLLQQELKNFRKADENGEDIDALLNSL